MSQSSIRDILEEFRTSKDPEKKAISAALTKYLDTRDPSSLSLLIPFNNDYYLGKIPEIVYENQDPDATAVLDFFFMAMSQVTTEFPSRRQYAHQYNQAPVDDFVALFLYGFFPFKNGNLQLSQRLLEGAERFRISRLRLATCLMAGANSEFLFGWKKTNTSARVLNCCSLLTYSAEEPPTCEADLNVFDYIVWDLSDEEILEFLRMQVKDTYTPRFYMFHGSLAVLKPYIIEKFLSIATPEELRTLSWKQMVRSSSQFDQQAIAVAKNESEYEALKMLILIDSLRPGTCTEDAIEHALSPQFLPDEFGVCYIRDHHPEKLPIYFTSCLTNSVKLTQIRIQLVETCFQSLIQQWNTGGKDFALGLVKIVHISWHNYPEGRMSIQGLLFRFMLEAESKISTQDLKEIGTLILESLERTPFTPQYRVETLCYLFHYIMKHQPELFREEIWSLMLEKAKILRNLVIPCIAKFPTEQSVPRTLDLLKNKKSDFRISAANLLGAIASPTATAALLAALEAESSEPVRIAIHEAINLCGESTPQKSFDLSALSIGSTKGLKMPNCTWLTIPKLPPLYDIDGMTLPEQTVAFLIAKQSKQKEIVAYQDIIPLLDYIDRSKSSAFALALVEGFLKSEQAASDRWALSIGGLLGDNQIIPPLLSRIQGWCDNARHKLAEYAAQAISLLPGNEPLMVLDTLANRYRSKYKNVGASCAQAFRDAATIRGISPAELGDMVVPTFEFDEDGLRIFSWAGGSIGAELGSDLKISWFDPDSEKTYKSLPASVPDQIKDETKLLGKLLRETIKGQTARLEMALVFQRKWTVARWRELYENHPVLRCFASGLVWGIYATNGTLLRTFRRYNNGILADVAGKEEELLENDTSIGMVHPLELEAADVSAWQAHLARLKVKQPFPQMDRPVELLDPQWGNRTQINITRDKKISAGTFRSRAEKRGWQRGSVADAGCITSYFKSYPGSEIEVILPTDNFYIGIDPMEIVELSQACFVKANTVTRGSYEYDDIKENDPRVIAFAQVPAVVYSETISDLKAIIATKVTA